MYKLPMNLQLFAEDDGTETPEVKTFTQEDVDRIVGERLNREKGKYEGYEDLRELADLVKSFGYEGATAAEIKAQLKAELDTRNKQQELKDLQDEAKQNGTSPELLAEIKALKAELTDIKQKTSKQDQEVEAKKKASEAWNAQVTEFQKTHADVDMEKLGQNTKFMKFLDNSNPKLTLSQVYANYLDVVSEAEKAAIAKITSNVNRSTSSGKGGGSLDAGTHGLSDHQQKLAKQNGMTYKEYAELLSHVK